MTGTLRTQVAIATVALGLAVTFTAPPATAGTTGQIDLFVGQRTLDRDFEPVDDATQIGFALSIGREAWPVRIAVDVMQAEDDASEATELGGLPVTGSADFDLTEVDVGLRRFMGDGVWRWHYGGGAAFVDAEVESVIADSFGTLFEGETSDSAIGLWVAVGGSWHFAEKFQAGVDVRYTDAELELDAGPEFDASAVQFGLTVGYRW